ncbi:MAG: energy-coupling factor ABC transporter permease [Clostridia bacterium]
MSHIHIPDGILHPIVWISGYVLTAIVLFFILRNIKGDEIRKKIPITALMAAVMLIAMSVPLGFIPVHLSLAVVVGIVLGPRLGFLAILTVNLMLALIGHGGMTIVGLNTIIIGAEMFLGYALFRLLRKKIRISVSAFCSAFLALLFSLSLMTGILVTSISVPQALSSYVTHEHDDHEEHEEEEHEDEWLEDLSFLGISGLAALAVIVLAGLLLESLATGLIIGFLVKARPDILGEAG